MRCGAAASAPLCELCVSFTAAKSPLTFDPRLIKGPSILDLLAQNKRLMLTDDPQKPYDTFDDSPPDWRSENGAASILRHMGFNGGAPLILSLSDAEVLHNILFFFLRDPAQDIDLAHQVESLKNRVKAVPYLNVTKPVEKEPPPSSVETPSSIETQEPSKDLPQPPEDRVLPPPPPTQPRPLPAPPEPLPKPPEPRPSEPKRPRPTTPPPPKDEAKSYTSVSLSPDVLAASKELETLRLEIERLSMIKGQMEGQRKELQNMLQVEKSALEEREVLLTAQTATLQSRQKELQEKENVLTDKEAEIKRAQKRLELVEFLLSVPNLDQKDIQVIRAKFQNLETLKTMSLTDLESEVNIDGSKAKELHSALHPTWSSEDTSLMEKAQMLLESGDLHNALQCYEMLLRKTPDNENLWFNKAEILGMIGDKDGALHAYSKVIELNDKNLVAWRERADLLFECSRIEEGIRTLKKLMEIDREQIEASIIKADNLSSRGNITDAILLYNAALECDPGNVRGILGLGDCLAHTGDLDMAEKMYTRALGRDPQNAKALFKKGSMLNRRGRWGAALQLFNRAIALDWNYVDPWVGKGDILLKQNKASEALACFEKAIEFDPKRATAWAGKAQAHMARKEIEKAERAKAKALEYSPEKDEEKEAEELIESLATDVGLKDRNIPANEASVDILKHVIKASKSISESQMLRRIADIALDRNDLEKALENYNSALEADPGDIDAWCGKGLTLRKMGRLSEAWAAYDQAFKIDPTREDAKHGRDACSSEEGEK